MTGSSGVNFALQFLYLLFFMALAVGIPVFLVAVLLGWLASGPLMRRRSPDPPVDPADLGLPAEPVSFTSRDNVTTLHGYWIPAPDAAGTVVLCGGQRGSLDGDLPDYGPMFHAAGFNLLVFDWRAHGRSEGRYVTFGVYEKEDLLGALDFLAARGETRVGLLGLSMGAVVAVIAAALSDRVTAVVCDSLPVRWSYVLAGMAKRAGVPWWLGWQAARWVLLVGAFRVGGNMFHTEPWRWAAHTGDTPFLLIHGDADDLVPREQIEQVYALLPGGAGELWCVPGAAHREAFAQAGDEYARRVVAWFSERL
jgi:fermentation-respiration switch protein FrsA (DUF1100 family)